MLQANIDESYGEGVFVLGGYVATPQQWEDFSERWRAALTTFNDGEPLHANVNKGKWGHDFWDRLTPFREIMRETVGFGVRISVDMDSLEEVMGGFVGENGEQWSQPYFFCFYVTISFILTQSGPYTNFFGKHDKLEFVFDSGNQKSVMPWWEKLWSSSPEAIRSRLVATPQFRNDDEWPPLQTADLKVWLERRRLAGQKDTAPVLPERNVKLISYFEHFDRQRLKRVRKHFERDTPRPGQVRFSLRGGCKTRQPFKF